MADDAARAMGDGAEAIPFNTMIGVKTQVAEKGHFEVLLPARPDLQNHMQAMHAVPITAPAEMASGCAVATALGDLFAEGYATIAKSLRVRYRKPAFGDLLAVARTDDTVIEKVKAQVRATDRADFEVPVPITNSDGDVVAEVVVEWAVRKFG
jgi:acyl-coenzyme A thioesterase PaaI-like protein